jgi:hypothetical protein
MIPKKNIKPGEEDILNPMADVRNYAAGTEDGMKPEEQTPGEEKKGNDGENKPYPGEIALPKESEDNDEIVLKQ